MWTLPRHQHLCAAASRAVRTPSLQDRGIRADVADSTTPSPLPLRLTLVGNPTVGNEDLRDVEAGYRAELASTVTLGIAAFRGRYRHLRTQEPGQPTLVFGDAGPYLALPIRFDDLGGATTHGVEIDAQWTPRPWWRLDGSFTGFHLTPRVDPGSGDAEAAASDANAPSRQWQLHSAWSIGRRATLDARLFRVGRLVNLGVPAYTRADARVELPVSRALSVSLSGQNLLTPRHAEFTGSGAQMTSTLVPRSARVQLTWRF
jgi:outer membrane receptor protein involved in Fe transport